MNKRDYIQGALFVLNYVVKLLEQDTTKDELIDFLNDLIHKHELLLNANEEDIESLIEFFAKGGKFN